MSRVSTCRRHTGALVLAVAAVFPTLAFGSGFQLIEQNASGLGNAFAGQAAGAGDASAVFFNPAALTRLKGFQVVGAVHAIDFSSQFRNAASGPPFLPGLTLPVRAGGAGGEAGAVIPVPNGYVSWEAGSRVWLGLGLNAPFGLTTDWDADWMGRFHATRSDIKTININPTIAFKVSPRLSIGVGVNYQKLEAELGQAVPYGGIAVGIAGSVSPQAMPAILAQLGGPAGLAREGGSRVVGDAWSWGYNAGLLATLGEHVRLGASYRSAIRHDLEGDVFFEGSPRFTETGAMGPLGAGINARFREAAILSEVELPDTVSVAGAYADDRFELLADWTWTGWSKVQDLDIRRADGSALSNVRLRFEDTWRVGLGFNYKATENWRLRVGTAFDKTPVQDAFRTPRLPDGDRVWAAAGFQRRLGRSGAVDAGFAHIFVKEAASQRPNQETPTSAPSGPLLGTYVGSVNVVSAQLRWTF